MTALTDRLSQPNPARIVIAEPTAGERLTFWTLESGKTYTYYATIASASGKVVGCKEDGVALSDQTSIANVEANAGSWYAAAGKIYVHPAGSDSPYDHTLQAILRFHFSDRPRIYDSIYYDPRIAELPDMSLRVEPEFGEVGQIGGGNLVLRNEDGFFDTLALQWDAGLLPIKMAIDPPGAEATYDEFDLVGTWKVRRWSTRDDKFTLQFDEVKVHIKKKIPIEFYSRDDYPLMAEEDLGKPIQIAYGMVLDVRPVCIDLTTKRFKVAGHAIWKFYAARIKNEATEAWGDTPMSDLDEANGELTIATWDLHQGVAVDFAGKPNPDGTLMENPADIVRDLLQTYLGVTDAEIDDV